MAKQGKTTKIIPAEPPGVPAVIPPNLPVNADNEVNPLADPQLSDDQDGESELSRVLAELGEGESDSKVMLFRVNRDTRESAFITEMLPSEFSLKRVADDFGGGMYNVRVYVPNFTPEGTRRGVKLAKNMRLKIAGEPKEPKRLDPNPAPAAAAVDPVAKMLEEQRAFNERLLTAIASRQPEKSTLEQLREMAEIKKILGDGNGARESDLAQFMKYMELHDKMQKRFMPNTSTLPPNASENAALLALAKDFMDMFRDSAGRSQPAAAALPAPDALAENADADMITGAHNPRAIVPATPTPAPAANPIPSQDEQMKMRDLVYKGYLVALCTQARANNDVTEAATMIYEQAPEDFIAQLFVPGFDWLSWLAGFNPDVKLYPAWFQKLHAKIAELDQETPNETAGGSKPE